MTSTAMALAGLIGWHLFLSLLIFGPRGMAFLFKGRAPNTYSPDGSGEPAWAVRACRAQANSYESFPFTGGILLLALAASQTHVTNELASLMLAARVLQSVCHLISTSVIFVLARFAFYFVQWALAAYWLWLMAM
ncbi:MAG: MAPEG family protein [Limnobacter sp.]|nr:MAPEG family protein [Limnobacter sp.]